MTDLAALPTGQLIAVRDDRSAITDEAFRIIDRNTNVIASLAEILNYLSALTLDATNENLDRLLRSAKTKETAP